MNNLFERTWDESVRKAERDVESGRAFQPKGLVHTPTTDVTKFKVYVKPPNAPEEIYVGPITASNREQAGVRAVVKFNIPEGTPIFII